MAQRYNGALSLLSDPGKAIVRTGQAQWLKVVQRLYLDHRSAQGPTSCTRRQYAERLDDLRSAAVVIGPFVFSRIDHYASNGKQAVTGIAFEQHTGLPRIDHPLSAAAKQWNAAIVRRAAGAQTSWCFGEPGTAAEQLVSFRIQSATPGFINARMSHYEQCGVAAADKSPTSAPSLLVLPAPIVMSATNAPGQLALDGGCRGRVGGPADFIYSTKRIDFTPLHVEPWRRLHHADISRDA